MLLTVSVSFNLRAMFFQNKNFNKNVQRTCDHDKKATAAQKTECNAALVGWLKQPEGHSATCEDEEDGAASDDDDGDEDEDEDDNTQLPAAS